jgi:type IV secretion system protein VirB9
MRQLASVCALATLCVGIAAWGSETPSPGDVDTRIRVVDYDPNQVYQLTGFYGYHIAIFFSPDETVLKTTAGYPDAWDVTTHGDFVTVKPIEKDPATNLLVVTNRRKYSFDLRAKAFSAHPTATYASDSEQIFVLRFRYPADEHAAQDAARSRAELQERLAKARTSEERTALAALAQLPPQPINRAYFYQGSNALAPYEAWDDGVFTYLKFYAQQDLPSAFIVNEDGTESIANKHFDKDVMVIEATAKRFRLRKGKTVVCVWNEGPDLHTPESNSGATERGAERVLKGQ